MSAMRSPRTATPSLDLERLRRLPPGGDTWQVVVVFGPDWVAPIKAGEGPELPLIGICHSRATGLFAMGAPGLPSQPGDPPAPLALSAMADLARDLAKDGCAARPAIVEVTDTALHTALAELLAELDIAVELVESADEIDEVIAAMRADLGGPLATLECFAADVSPERIAAYAEAAITFYDAAPWNHLCDLDLVHVESRDAPEAMRWFVVLGGAGIEFGLGFFHDVRDFQILRDSRTDRPPAGWMRQARWSLTFDPPCDLPLGQYERWVRHRLPTTRDGRYPLLLALHPDGTNEPADEKRLAFLETLLRGLAVITEDELDSGRWSHEGRVAGKARTITLAIPTLLTEETLPGVNRAMHEARAPLDRRSMEREMAKIGRLFTEEGLTVDQVNARIAATAGKLPDGPPPTDPEARAQALYYDALDVQGRLRIKRAREAVRLWPDCTDALVLLGEETPDRVRARSYFELAFAAGERSLGAEAFGEHRGHFWGVFVTRPYMRARYALADLLWHEGERDKAILHWMAMLELNPIDNQGVRELLIPRLIECNREEEAREFIARFPEDGSAFMRYAEALAAFRLLGRREETTRLLARAARSNAHVLKYLLDPSRLPGQIPSSFRFGDEDEAAIAAAVLHGVWRATPGGEDWLREYRREAKKTREKGRKGKR